MIQLIDGLVMTADENSYIVGQVNEQRSEDERGVSKAQKLMWSKYYPTAAQAVSAALARALRRRVADGSITTLREFIQEQERLRGELEKLVAPLGGG